MKEMDDWPESEADLALERAPWCLLVPTEDPDDPDIIGPFATFKEAENWSLSCPESTRIRKMSTPEHVILIRRERIIALTN